MENMELMGYREITEKDGVDLDDIFYVTSFVRLWSCLNCYVVQANQSGNGGYYFSQSYSRLEDAQKAYDTIEGVLALTRKRQLQVA